LPAFGSFRNGLTEVFVSDAVDDRVAAAGDEDEDLLACLLTLLQRTCVAGRRGSEKAPHGREHNLPNYMPNLWHIFVHVTNAGHPGLANNMLCTSRLSAVRVEPVA